MTNGAEPGAELVVVLGAAQVALVAEVGLGVAVGATARTGRPATFVSERSRLHLVDLPFIEAIVPPLTPPFIAVTTSVVSAELARRLVEQQHAEVGRDRVEAAGVHDPRAARLRGARRSASIVSRMNRTSPVRSA